MHVKVVLLKTLVCVLMARKIMRACRNEMILMSFRLIVKGLYPIPDYTRELKVTKTVSASFLLVLLFGSIETARTKTSNCFGALIVSGTKISMNYLSNIHNSNTSNVIYRPVLGILIM